MTTTPNSMITLALSFIGAVFCWRADAHRRRLSLAHFSWKHLLSFLDVGCVGISIGAMIILLVVSPHFYSRPETLFTPATLGILACFLSLLFLWSEGRRQVQLQRPAGIVFGEWAILLGIYQIGATMVFHTALSSTLGVRTIGPIIAGASVLGYVLPRFLKGHEEHRILDRIDVVGESQQPEYAGSTPECPFPERWQMLDAQSAEVEVLDFLKLLVITVKPDVILETGTFIGHSAMKMAEGLKANGFGKIVTIEYDPLVFAKAKQNIDSSGLADWIEYCNGSSLEANIGEPIDILFSDSDINIRESEIRRFLPRIKPRGLVLVHDASSSVNVVRDAVLRLEQEGLLSVVLLSTPRGLVIAQAG